MVLPDLIPKTKSEVDEMVKYHPEDVVFALIGDVGSAIKEEFRKIAHKLRPVPMSPTFITVNKEVSPDVTLENSVALLRHGSTYIAELKVSDVEPFVKANQEPKLLNFNTWWQKITKIVDIFAMIVVDDMSEKALYTKDLLILESEFTSPGSYRKREYGFGFLVNDGGDTIKMLKKRYQIKLGKAPLFFLFNNFSSRYAIFRLVDYTSSEEKASAGLVAILKKLMKNVKWIRVPEIKHEKHNEILKHVTLTRTMIFTILIGILISGFVYCCSNKE